MKKIITAWILVLALIIVPITCFADDTSEVNTADALNELGLFLGTGSGYELKRGLGRAEGVTLLVRMIGMEETAKSNVYHNAFTDIPDWAAAYIGYAYANGITNGTGDTTFSPDLAMTDYMFLTLVLRALNYPDTGDAPLFVWNNPYDLAYELKLIDTVEPDTDFTRGDAIGVFWNALDAKLNGTDTVLADRLVEQKVFTADALADARKTQENGRTENVGVPLIPTVKPETPETETPETEAVEPEIPGFVIPEIETPETEAPETEAPETEAPETEAPETEAPETEAPETEAPETEAPETEAPETEAPETEAPETEAPETESQPNVGDDLGDGGLPVAP